MTRIILIIILFILSCDEPAVEGCTSPSACNFNPKATKADGSCMQPEGCNDWCPEDSGSPGELDCNDECLGDGVFDECGECMNPECGNETESSGFALELNPCTEENDAPLNDQWNSSCLDCSGNPNGTLILDCNGDCGGEAEVDECGTCAGGNTINDSNYLKDCNGDCLGSAIIDECGICTEGNTGFITNFQKDECGICNGDGYRAICLGSDGCENMDCEGVCNPDDAGYSTTNECASQCSGIEGCGWMPDENCADCGSFGVCALYGAGLDNCESCFGGVSNNTACVEDCDGIWGGETILDCSGNCGGNAVADECGVCDGAGAIYECGCSGIEEGKCDCAGNEDDECGICGGPGVVEGENCDGECIALCDNPSDCNLGLEHGGTGPGLDCLGICNGSAVLDECGVCNGNNYILQCAGSNSCSHMDCTGLCDGTAAVDCNGVCNGGTINDCAGVCGGNSMLDPSFGEDDCNADNGYVECDDDPSNDCIQDCNNDWGGSAEIDNCGTCAGGNTGTLPNEGTTPDGLYSCSDITLLVNAEIDGCNDADSCVNLSCSVSGDPLLLWDGINLSGFDFTGCNIENVPAYVTDFDINTLNLSDNRLNNFPENIINMTTLTDIDLRFNLINNIPNSVCTLLDNTLNPCTIHIQDNLGIDCSQVPDCNSGTINCE